MVRTRVGAVGHHNNRSSRATLDAVGTCGWCHRDLASTTVLCPSCGHRVGTSPGGPTTNPWGTAADPTAVWAGHQSAPRPANGAAGAIAFAAVALVVLLIAGAAVYGVVNPRNDDGFADPLSGPPIQAPSPTVGTVVESDDRRTVDLGDTATAEPLLGETRVYVPLSYELVALDRTSLEELWRAPCDLGSWWEPVPHELDDAILARCDGELTLFDAATGETRWRGRGPSGFGNYARASGAAIVSSDEDGIVVYSTDTGEELWRRSIEHVQGNHPIEAAGDLVFVSEDRTLRAFDADTGDERWRAPLPTAAVLYADGTLYVRTDDHQLAAVDAATGTITWRSERDRDRYSWAGIVGVTETTVVVESGKDGRLIVADRSDGHPLWDDDAAAVAAGPGLVLIADLDGTIAVDDRTGDPIETLSDVWDASSDGTVLAYTETTDGITDRLVLWTPPG